ncbi:unnamed protein product, partial [Mesorhabditis belari]|uniref:Uncharacterized protein n=1 Tax=Mesorhabditis belari TaxID=2138241 RepID=A0AAF3F7Q6_9BILA
MPDLGLNGGICHIQVQNCQNLERCTDLSAIYHNVIGTLQLQKADQPDQHLRLPATIAHRRPRVHPR